MVWACSAGFSAIFVKKCRIKRRVACNLVGWRAKPSMAILAVHIAPPGTNAVGAGKVARWLSGGLMKMG